MKKIKSNLFLICVVLAYAAVFLINTQTGIEAVKNNGYYLKEMLMIMPVIFILTALLDTWISKETITKHLGKGSKIKGVILAFILGGVSAGPIYAAFPICVMLRKKGASVQNIVIILSSWAVIKIPMLLNEAKFLGLKFMVVRYVLTVVAIIIFSWITSKIVKSDEMAVEEVAGEVTVNHSVCMGCGICVKICPEIFEIQERKARLKTDDFKADNECLEKAIEGCPVNAIMKN